jgi:alcohol dehydrogenase (NADP+)
MFTVKARAMASATDPFRPITIQRPNHRPEDILIDIDSAGICHADVHHAGAQVDHTFAGE